MSKSQDPREEAGGLLEEICELVEALTIKAHIDEQSKSRVPELRKDVRALQRLLQRTEIQHDLDQQLADLLERFLAKEPNPFRASAATIEASRRSFAQLAGIGDGIDPSLEPEPEPPTRSGIEALSAGIAGPTREEC